MALSTPKLLLPSLKTLTFSHNSHSIPHLPLYSFVNPITSTPLLTTSLLTKPSTQPRHIPSAKTDDSLSSMLTELELDDEDENLDVLHPPNDNPKPHQSLNRVVGNRWQEIHGRDDWAGLLDPIDPLLRSELIRYGEFAQACYDAFDYDPFSRYCGSSKYIRRRFFESLGMADVGYDVVRFIYATSNLRLPNFFKKSNMGDRLWSQRANWIGYIAVSNDETTARLGRRDIVVAWRGTVTRLEWMADLMDFLRPVRSEGIPCPDPAIKVESGFVDLYTDKDPNCRFCKYSAREQVLSSVRKLVDEYTKAGEDVSISVTGHSLGSALAILSAYDMAETGADIGEDGKRAPIAVFSFSGPRVGNGPFKERFEGLGIKALRVVNLHDTVPKVPGVLFNENVPQFVTRLVDWLPWTYSHVGVELELDHRHSPFLKDTGDPSCFHNLEAHLHLLDGYHGKGQRFVLVDGRDPALVNKACDFLKDHHMVPPFWRQDENKGMIRANDGRWVQPERQKHDDHPEDTHHHLRHLGLIEDA